MVATGVSSIGIHAGRAALVASANVIVCLTRLIRQKSDLTHVVVIHTDGCLANVRLVGVPRQELSEMPQ